MFRRQNGSTSLQLCRKARSWNRWSFLSRGTSTFNVCLGALYIGTGSPSAPWKQVAATKKGPLRNSVPSGGRYWGTPADCGTPGLNASFDPCIALRTKQASAVQAYFGLTAAQTAAIMTDADLAIIVHKPFPWDGRGGVN